MGDIADAMISGDMDCVTGEWLGDGAGFPRTLEPNHPNSINPQRKNKMPDFRQYNSKALNGIAKFLHMKGYNEDQIISIIYIYCGEELDIDLDKLTTLRWCAEKIQEDFGRFAKYIKKQKT